ncbi:MAG: arginase [Rhizobiales bacterium]|nr:arginase [Hyphomicrobiales bacterium]
MTSSVLNPHDQGRYDMRVPAITAERARTILTVEVACGAGALDPGCKAGPAAFRQHWDDGAVSTDVQLVWERMPPLLCQDGMPPLESVAQTARWLAERSRRLTEDDSRFLVIGGDHSFAVGTWSGVSDALRHRGPLGLIWIDAHMDMHVPETTHSGAINGMPVAALLGYGAPELTGLAGNQRAVDPRHICLVGARSFEPEEVTFAKRHGVRVIGMDECARRGIADSLAEARAIATNGTVGYGVSLDLDAFDPADAPGVGTPAPDGIRASEFLDLWADLTRSPTCRGIELVEYNPFRDRENRTARLMSTLVAASAVGDER